MFVCGVCKYISLFNLNYKRNKISIIYQLNMWPSAWIGLITKLYNQILLIKMKTKNKLPTSRKEWKKEERKSNLTQGKREKGNLITGTFFLCFPYFKFLQAFLLWRQPLFSGELIILRSLPFWWALISTVHPRTLPVCVKDPRLCGTDARGKQ